MQLILQPNDAPAPNIGLSIPASRCSPNQGSPQAFQLPLMYPQYHNQHHVGGDHQQVHAIDPLPQNCTQPIYLGGHQPQLNYQQPQPG